MIIIIFTVYFPQFKYIDTKSVTENILFPFSLIVSVLNIQFQFLTFIFTTDQSEPVPDEQPDVSHSIYRKWL
jgi:hypothetical protein